MCDHVGHDVRRIGEDREAFECLYVEHIDLVQAFFARRVSDPSLVADLTSEVFLASIEAAKKYRPEKGTPTGWLYGIARHVMADEVRRQQRQERTTRRISGRRLLDPDAVTALVERLDAESEMRRVYVALAQLPDRHRALMELVALDGLTIADAAAVLGLKPATARVQLHRVRQQMQSTLGPLLEAPITTEVQP